MTESLPDNEQLPAPTSFFATAPGGFLFTDPDGRIVRVNETLAGWLGYTAGQLGDGSHMIGELVTRGGRLYYETYFLPLLRLQERVEEINLTLQGREGKRIPVLVSADRHRTADGREYHVFVVIRYTQRQRYEEELRQAKQRAESSDRAKSYFLSTISHEVLTPINAILGMADLLGSTRLTEQQRHLQSILLSSGRHLLDLFQNVLIVAKSGLDKLELANRPFDLRQLATTITDSFRFDDRRQHVRISLHLDDDLPPTLLGDPTVITQLLTNLVGNAVKFTEEGEVCLHVSAGERGKEEQQVIHFSVTDTGIGIDPEEVERLFQPFQQLNTEVQQRYGGSGLGLAICQQILQRLGSELRVDSEPGRGSRFFFSLRLGTTDAPIPTRPASTLPAIDRGRCLLVEDNETNAFLATRYLKRWGVAFDLAVNGEEALGFFRERTYDLILMDLQMPVLNGYDAAAAIRQQEKEGVRTPIVAFSAASESELDRSMEAAGIDGFLRKPFVAQELYATLLRYISPTQVPNVAPSERFPRIIEVFEDDDEAVQQFMIVLQRELRQAADQFEGALATANTTAVADLKHKLKTSLSLLEAGQLTELIAGATALLRSGQPVPPALQRQIVAGLREQAGELATR
jgi:PAS domain S-box-containing protein